MIKRALRRIKIQQDFASVLVAVADCSIDVK